MTRRRYIWDTERNELVEVGPDYTSTPRHANDSAPMTDLYMDGVRATDGTDIGSRKKRREYMRRNNLIDADDMKGQWARNRADAERRDEAGRRQDVLDTLKGRR